ncbi:TPR repeat-containing thioredoxin TDX [Platanthera zijinensis]|uniref:TPR repeat-containing thioredoxin TDX n=1 Tax=Platanthera zijinensis TaxID=2320716 RepID=A0AAP0B8Q6_9ASPA
MSSSGDLDWQNILIDENGLEQGDDVDSSSDSSYMEEGSDQDKSSLSDGLIDSEFEVDGVLFDDDIDGEIQLVGERAELKEPLKTNVGIHIREPGSQSSAQAQKEVESEIITERCRDDLRFMTKSHNNQKSDGMPNAEFSDSNNSKKKSTDIDDGDDDDNDDEIVESDIELEGEVVEPDNDPPQKMGDPTVEVTEESRYAAQIYKARAVDAMSEASVFVKMRKPNAAIRDADAALQINPDSAKGYKSRGMAKALLGKWEEAASDLHIASKLDHDEEIHSILKMVEPNAQKIEEHRRRYERLRKKGEQNKAGKEHLRAEVGSFGDEFSIVFDAGGIYRQRKIGDLTLHAMQNSDGQLGPGGSVLSIHMSGELNAKLDAAAILSRLAIIYFTATWCGPCRFMAPAYMTLAEQHPKVVFLKIDIDEVGDAARRWNISTKRKKASTTPISLSPHPSAAAAGFALGGRPRLRFKPDVAAEETAAGEALASGLGSRKDVTFLLRMTALFWRRKRRRFTWRRFHLRRPTPAPTRRRVAVLYDNKLAGFLQLGKCVGKLVGVIFRQADAINGIDLIRNRQFGGSVFLSHIIYGG